MRNILSRPLKHFHVLHPPIQSSDPHSPIIDHDADDEIRSDEQRTGENGTSDETKSKKLSAVCPPAGSRNILMIDRGGLCRGIDSTACRPFEFRPAH